MFSTVNWRKNTKYISVKLVDLEILIKALWMDTLRELANSFHDVEPTNLLKVYPNIKVNKQPKRQTKQDEGVDS
jgi:hypothetical protein